MANKKSKSKSKANNQPSHKNIAKLRRSFYEHFVAAMPEREIEIHGLAEKRRISIAPDLGIEVVFWPNEQGKLNNLQMFDLLAHYPDDPNKPLILYIQINCARLFNGPRMRWSRSCTDDNADMRIEIMAVADELPALAKWVAKLVESKEYGEECPRSRPPFKLHFPEPDYLWTEGAAAAWAAFRGIEYL